MPGPGLALPHGVTTWEEYHLGIAQREGEYHKRPEIRYVQETGRCSCGRICSNTPQTPQSLWRLSIVVHEVRWSDRELYHETTFTFLAVGSMICGKPASAALQLWCRLLSPIEQVGYFPCQIHIVPAANDSELEMEILERWTKATQQLSQNVRKSTKITQKTDHMIHSPRKVSMSPLVIHA